ncbi:hypothetical protein [Nitrosomonas sp. ANs5]|uniref:hypothetical protein n=1 Tax=Nitrosomonas sp. ANs5 TaxID=3423941 RepID=UPI003D333132
MASESTRKLILWGALALTLLAVIWVEDEPEMEEPIETIRPAKRVAGNASGTAKSHESLPVEQLGKRAFSAEADDIFAVTSWEPKRPPAGSGASSPFGAEQLIVRPAAPAPAPAPTAPPLQFKYLGRVSEGQKTRIFLTQLDKNHVAAVGERIDDKYRVDRIREDAIELTYLPLGIKQTLLINDKNPGRIQ